MREQVERLRDAALRKKVGFAEVRFASVTSSSLMVQDGRADRVGTGQRAGLGVRVIANGAWGFAATESSKYSEWLRCLNSAPRDSPACPRRTPPNRPSWPRPPR